jgi:hypothetical protein
VAEVELQLVASATTRTGIRTALGVSAALGGAISPMNNDEIEELMGLIRCLALQMVDIREDLALLRALAQKGAVCAQDLQVTEDFATNVCDLAREKIRKIGTNKAASFNDPLGFRRSIQ